MLIRRRFPTVTIRRSRGATMIEVLVSFLILTAGLLGVAGLQARIQTAEIEAYQRAQAVVLLQDMVDRVNANRKNAADYVTASALGTGSTLDCSAPATIAAKDLCEWDAALAGAAETTGGGASKLGAMNEGRGCISNPVTTMPREIVVSVVWQGIAPTVVPGATKCGADEAA